MLHDKRNKSLTIRLSEDEFIDLQKFVYVQFGGRFTVSDFVRRIILQNIYYDYE